MKKTENPDMLYTDQQVKMFVKDVKADLGEGTWKYLSRMARVQVVKAKALDVLRASAREEKGFRVVEIDALLLAMLREAGLADEEG